MMTADSMTTPADQRIEVSRVIDAPVARVWRAWTDPAEVAKWWGPFGFTTNADEREFKVGGTWRHTMIGPDGKAYPNLARFEEIVPNTRIVYTNSGGDGEGAGVSFRSTVTFEDVGGRTKLTLSLVFETTAMKDIAMFKYGAIEGGRQTLTRLAATTEGGFVMSRMVSAPRERVWRAWTDPKELAMWFGPKGFETTHSDLDFRVGGSYHYAMSGNGVTMWGKWEFREIVPPSKFQVLQWFSDEHGGVTRHPLAPDWPRKKLSTIELQDFGPKTLITVLWFPYEATEKERQTFIDSMSGMNTGWTGTFERLDQHLETSSK